MTDQIKEIEPFSLQAHLASLKEEEFLLVDVRTPQEYENGHIPGSRLIPLDEIETRLDELPATGELIFYCLSGKRSMAAALLSRDSGKFDKALIANLKGGFSEYEGTPLTGFPRLETFPQGRTVRETLLWAMNMEKGAERIYASFSSGDSPIKKTFGRLASLERAHARTVYQMLVRKEQLPPFEQVYATLAGEIIEGGESIDEVLARMNTRDCRESAELALEIEQLAYDLYKNLASREGEENFKAVLLALAEAEKDHIRILAKMFRECD
jgi:sulfur-carrier protein adenylyltransferase/sulfurtransferase